MASVSFINMDQAFDITSNANAAFSGASGALTGFNYSYVTTGSHDWEFKGTGITSSGGVLTGGTITKIQVDLDDDAQTVPEIIISTLGGVAATSFGIGVGTADQQRDKFWIAALGGADTIDFTMLTYTNNLKFAADGANLDDGLHHVGANDTLTGGASALTGVSIIAGDYYDIFSGSVQGGDDLITVGAFAVYGDFSRPVAGSSAVGGDDVIAPNRLADTPSLAIFISGDVGVNDIPLTGGDDLIDLRTTDVSALSLGIVIHGDTSHINPGGTLVGGNDTVYGSSEAEQIFGDYETRVGAATGGKDSLSGNAGNDTIFGNEGRDFLSGGNDNDSLNGGADADTIDGGAGDDSADGDAGNDSILGGDGNDTVLAGSGNDYVSGGVGDDNADAAAGVDTMFGGASRDSFFGGSGNDTMLGEGGNDTLQGGTERDTLRGGGGLDVLIGGDGDDRVDGGVGNDILFGDAGNDTIIFAINYDQDLLRDFVAGAAVGDVIGILGFGAAFDTFAEVLAAATDNGVDTTINFGGGDILIIRNTLVSQLNANDFSFG